MESYNLDKFRGRIILHFSKNGKKVNKWVEQADKRIISGIVGENRKICIAYLLYNTLPNELRLAMNKKSGWQTKPICDIMFSVCKEINII